MAGRKSIQFSDEMNKFIIENFEENPIRKDFFNLFKLKFPEYSGSYDTLKRKFEKLKTGLFYIDIVFVQCFVFFFSKIFRIFLKY